jgi:peptidyl-prolyl cis-trans isomerase D
MLTVIRKNQQVLMLVIAILTIIAFIWLYNPMTKSEKYGDNDVATVYGKVVQRAEIDRQVRGYQLALALGLTDFVRDLGGMGANEETSLSDFILNLLVIQHQAPVLGLHPSDEAVAGVIKNIPLLQTDGSFDPAKYAAFIQDQLAPKGFTERQLEEIVRDSLCVKEIRRIITSPVAVGEGQVREAARIYQPVTARILRFERDAFTKSATVAPEEIATFYTKNKDGLQSREARSISYVAFDLPAAQQKLQGKEKTTALQKLADQVVETGRALREGVAKGVGFAKAAEKAALHPIKALSVERDGSQGGKDSGVPEQVVAGAFRLAKTGEVSDIIQDGNSFYIVTVEGVSPARQLELAEVTERIAALLTSEKAGKLAAEVAAKKMDQIRAALAAGSTFSDAATKAGVKTQTITGVTPSDAKGGQEAQALSSATLSLKEGELGPLQPAPWGAFAAYLEKRAPLTDDQWKQYQGTLSKTLLSNEQELLFLEWLNSSRAAAQIKMMGGNGRGGHSDRGGA